jgi:hypothetical protein
MVGEPGTPKGFGLLRLRQFKLTEAGKSFQIADTPKGSNGRTLANTVIRKRV